MEKINEPGLRAYVVWLPVQPQARAGLGGPAARRESVRVPDPRARHFYDSSALLGRLFREPLGLPEQSVAWDVFLVFRPGEMWTRQLPNADFWMHQLSARWWREADREAAARRRLDPETFRRHVESLLRERTRLPTMD